MGHIKEPKGIDFLVGPSKLTKEDRMSISKIIAEFKKTGKIPKSKATHRKNKKQHQFLREGI